MIHFPVAFARVVVVTHSLAKTRENAAIFFPEEMQMEVTSESLCMRLDIASFILKWFVIKTNLYF